MTQNGYTALLWACNQGDAALVQILLEAKADLNLTDTVSPCIISMFLCVKANNLVAVQKAMVIYIVSLFVL